MAPPSLGEAGVLAAKHGRRPYLARQMSCLGRRTPEVKDTPFLGSTRGVKKAGRRHTQVTHVELSDPTFKQSTQRRREFTQVQAARRLKALLLHVWIEMFIMV